MMFEFLLLVVCLVCACSADDEKTYTVNNEPNNPVQWFKTTTGWGGIERVVSIYAEIRPHHLTNNSPLYFLSFSLKERFNYIKYDGDLEGLLIPSRFSGPLNWYNLSPQNVRVNTNLGFHAITIDWWKAECEVATFFRRYDTEKPSVIWSVEMFYAGNSNRPYEYLLGVNFCFHTQCSDYNSIGAQIFNPFVYQDRTFYICNQSLSNTCSCKCVKKDADQKKLEVFNLENEHMDELCVMKKFIRT